MVIFAAAALVGFTVYKVGMMLVDAADYRASQRVIAEMQARREEMATYNLIDISTTEDNYRRFMRGLE